MHLANTLCAYNSIQGGNLLNNDKNVNLEKPAYCRSFPRNKEKKKKKPHRIQLLWNFKNELKLMWELKYCKINDKT